MHNKIDCFVIDDEPGSIVTIQELLKEYCPWVNVIGTASNPKMGVELIEKNYPDLVFLDIEMPYGTAFDLLDKLAPVTFEVIFITAFNNYAIKAFKYAAIDYLLKPLNILELQAAVQKVSKRLEEKKTNTRINVLLNHLKESQGNSNRLGLATIDGFRFEEMSSVMYLRADGSYTHVHLLNNVVETVSKNLKEYEDILPESMFCRVHHSYIININFVKKYFRGRGGFVEMEDGTKIEIASRKKDEFLKRFIH